jgi:hypothetical protein
MSFVERAATGIQLLKTLNPRRMAQYVRSLTVDEWADPILAGSFFGPSSDVMRLGELDEQRQDLQMKVGYRQEQLGKTSPQGDAELVELTTQLDSIAVEEEYLRNLLRYKLESDLRLKRLVARGFVAPFTPSSPRVVIPHEHWSILRLSLKTDTAEGAGVRYLSVEIGRVGSRLTRYRYLFRARMRRFH